MDTEVKEQKRLLGWAHEECGVSLFSERSDLGPASKNTRINPVCAQHIEDRNIKDAKCTQSSVYRTAASYSQLTTNKPPLKSGVRNTFSCSCMEWLNMSLQKDHNYVEDLESY